MNRTYRGKVTKKWLKYKAGRNVRWRIWSCLSILELLDEALEQASFLDGSSEEDYEDYRFVCWLLIRRIRSLALKNLTE